MSKCSFWKINCLNLLNIIVVIVFIKIIPKNSILPLAKLN